MRKRGVSPSSAAWQGTLHPDALTDREEQLAALQIRTSDYLLVRFAQRARPLLRYLANWETRFLSADLAPIALEKPVFVAGLARSGTTLLLELLASIEGVATHRYRDFPFVLTPYLWNRYVNWFPVREEPQERAHRDRVQITHESPEAFEELVWQTFFPHVHSRTAIHRLTAADRNWDFDAFYQAHLRKILLIRAGRRYVSKGNYNITRLEYLANLFPDAHFVIPIRHPISHVHSLVRQHELFSEYARSDARVPDYLRAAGHFEFGPQRVPIQLDLRNGDRAHNAWERGEEHRGYSMQWADVYRFVDRLRNSDTRVAPRLHLIRYEDFCADPAGQLERLLRSLEVDLDEAKPAFRQLSRVMQPRNEPDLTPDVRAAISEEVSHVAERFEYSL